MWTDEEFRYVCAGYIGEGKPKGRQDLSNAIEGVTEMFGKKYSPFSKIQYLKMKILFR